MRKFFLSSIRTRLILLFVIGIVPVFLLLLHNFRVQKTRALEQATEEAEAIFRFGVLNEQEVFQEIRELLARLAKDPEVYDGKNCDGYLKSLLAVYPRFVNFGVIRPDGNLVCSAIPFTPPLNLGHRSYYRGVLDTSLFTVGEFQIGAFSGNPVINFGQPMFDERKKLSGVLFGGLDLSYITEFDAEISGMLLPGSTYVRVDSSGRVLSGIPGSSLYRIGEPIGASIMETISRAKVGRFTSVDADGEERLYLFSTLWGALYGYESHVLLGIPTRVLNAEPEKILFRNILILAMVTAATGFLLWYGGNRLVVGPVNRLVDASEMLARGDLTARAALPLETGELGHLGHAFDDMAEELEKNARNLSEVQARLEHILSVSPAVVYACRFPRRDEGQVPIIPVFLSERIRELLGYEPSEILGDPWWHSGKVHPEDAAWEETQSDLLGSGRQSLEYRLRAKDGAYRWLLDQRVLVRDALGAPLEVVGSLTDITRRKEAEETLALLAMAVTDAAEGFIISDDVGVVEYVNPAYEQITGYSGEDMVGRNILEFNKEKRDREYRTEVDRAVLAGKVWKGRSVNHRKDGTPYHEDATISPVRDASGKIIHVVASIRDVTQETLLQKQLQIAQRMEAVGTLAGGIAHDFNNSLTGIFGFTEIAAMKAAGNREVLANLEEVRRCADRAATLTRQLLAYSRRQSISPVNLNLNGVITELLKLVSKIVGAQVRIRTCLEKDLPSVHADVGQVEQVLMNLVINSRDAMPAGGDLVIETGIAEVDDACLARRPYMKAGRYVVLSVSDTGVGMDEKTRESVFEPFFTTKSPDKGTGLGLAMVYGIVKQHQGYINLYSEPGKGTVFRIYLPAVDAPPDAAVPPKPEAVPGGKETVLLADDDESIRAIVKQALEGLGYTVLVSAGGDDAVSALERHRDVVSLALLDAVMPGLSGKELFEAVRRVSPGLKVVFMSGYTEASIRESFVALPDVPFLTKPFTRIGLARKVRDALDAPA